MKILDRLLSHTSAPISDEEPNISEQLLNMAGHLANDLVRILSKRNGFYAFESALHVFPAKSNQTEIGLDEWNENTLWRDAYQGMANNCLFFAEDAFGGQFCIKNSKIYTFDPETGDLNYLADDIENWAKQIMNDYNVLTGYPLMHQWQTKNGVPPVKMRLIPKIPFVAGGEFLLGNLYLADAVQGMKYRADIANQIKYLPDGGQIKLEIVN